MFRIMCYSVMYPICKQIHRWVPTGAESSRWEKQGKCPPNNLSRKFACTMCAPRGCILLQAVCRQLQGLLFTETKCIISCGAGAEVERGSVLGPCIGMSTFFWLGKAPTCPWLSPCLNLTFAELGLLAHCSFAHKCELKNGWDTFRSEEW